MYFSIMEEKMDNQKLAELLFPDVTKTPEYYEEKYPYRKLPNKAEVTRLAPSPTGFIHLGNLIMERLSAYKMIQEKNVWY